MNLPRDEYWMREAIKVARGGWGTTHPNPVVGAILADGDKCLSTGYHAKAGEPHAEVYALRGFEGGIPESATLYVTLEPCSSVGRTGACTDAIREAGVKRVVVGALDNDPRHQGRGLDRLREAGIAASAGVLEEECRDLNLLFHFRNQTGHPMIAAKVATTIDGRTAASSGASRWITGEKAREDVHRWRRYFPAIAVGAGTVLADDPALTSRRGTSVFCPARLVFDRSGRLAEKPDCRVLTDEYRERTAIFCGEEVFDGLRTVIPEDVKVEVLPNDPELRDSLRQWLVRHELDGLFVEGGSALFRELFATRTIDYLFAYRAPKLFLDNNARPIASGWKLVSPGDAIQLEDCRHETFDSDQLIRGRVCYPGERESL
ncbi:MAG: bifunctional diaminohydroxyphosphoribosylaminopyrimidine deaminase/5-amino-6-(5-phosphoribosylamino)uracil reductase RibD [Verrucomicrobiota bacterium]